MTWDRIYTLYWVTWFLVGFGGVEASALLTGHPERTLSENVWTLEGNGQTIARYMVAAFCLWVFLHMVFKEFRVVR